ncbi:MAG: metallophosphoesterase, partial [Pseudomonadota bacterium]
MATTLLLFTSATAVAQWQFDDVERVVAISDIHGDNQAMLATLRAASIVDENARWSAGTTHLVVDGDIIDRGPDSRAAMDVLMRLEHEAAAAGGRVHIIIGNHEAMVLAGDMRYVSAGEYQAFAEDETAAEREHWFRAYQALRAAPDADPAALRTDFDERFPSGFFALRRGFASDGQYGAWLLQKSLLVVINDTAFVHAGLSPLATELGLDGINNTLMSELKTYVSQAELLFGQQLLLPTDSFYDHPQLLEGFEITLATDKLTVNAVSAVLQFNSSKVHDIDGPVWYRGNVYCNPIIETDRLAAALDTIGANRVVVGHTPTPGRVVLARLEDRVIEIDTGMFADYYRGSGNALIIENDTISVLNQSGETVAAPVSHPREVGRRPGAFLTATALEELLTNGEVVSRAADESGRVLLTVTDGSHMVDAIFAEPRRRGVFPEVAAYKLDRMLGLDMVPVTVQRDIDGNSGSLQFMPTRWIDEMQRYNEGGGGGAMCPLNDQWNAMMVFDTLIHNNYRTAKTIRYNQSNWQMMLSDHGRAFATSSDRPENTQRTELVVGDSWRR